MKNMTVNVQPDANSFNREAARRIFDQIVSKPDSVIGLSTGRTTGNLHRTFARMARERSLDLSYVTFFGLDEVVGVPETYAGACCAMLRSELIDDLGIAPDRFLMLPTQWEGVGESVRIFTETLEELGGIDLLVLGLGENGHLGFNQPGSPFGCTARVTEVGPELDERFRRELSLSADAPIGGATLGIKDIMHSRRILLVANGLRKAPVVKEILQGPVTEEVPGSVLQLHPLCEYLLDSEAASLL